MTEREKMREQYPELFAKLESIFFKHDPIGINFGSNPDEYAAEVGTVLKRLPSATSQEEVQTMVYEVFCSWFDPHLAGDKNSVAYKGIAKETWESWCEEWGK